MADHRQESSQELLTKREREAIQILAKEIVREAELNDKDNSDREALKVYVDLFKHLATFGSAIIAAALVIRKDLGFPSIIATPILVLFGASVLLSVYGLVVAVPGVTGRFVPSFPGLGRLSIRSVMRLSNVLLGLSTLALGMGISLLIFLVLMPTF